MQLPAGIDIPFIVDEDGHRLTRAEFNQLEFVSSNIIEPLAQIAGNPLDVIGTRGGKLVRSNSKSLSNRNNVPPFSVEERIMAEQIDAERKRHLLWKSTLPLAILAGCDCDQ